MGDRVAEADLLQVYPRSEGGPPKQNPMAEGQSAVIHLSLCYVSKYLLSACAVPSSSGPWEYGSDQKSCLPGAYLYFGGERQDKTK